MVSLVSSSPVRSSAYGRTLYRIPRTRKDERICVHRQHRSTNLTQPSPMLKIFKQFITIVTKYVPWRGREARGYLKALEIGLRVVDEEPTRRRVLLTAAQRTMHIAVIGKSGSGKSSLLKHMCQQDIEADRGFVYFDLHGDATPFLLRSIAARERKLRRHLSERLVIIAPGDPELSVGLNPLEQDSLDFVRIAEFA